MRDIIHGCYTVFPIPLGMGAIFDPSLMEECSYMSAKEGSVSGSHSRSKLLQVVECCNTPFFALDILIIRLKNYN